MSSIGRGNLKCITPKCGRVRPYWSDHCAKCRKLIPNPQTPMNQKSQSLSNDSDSTESAPSSASKAAFTPGPWVYCSQPSFGYVRPLAPGECIVSFHPQPGRTEEEGRANARLIASSPHLLSLVQQAARFLEFRDDSTPDEISFVVEARALIAKATQP